MYTINTNRGKVQMAKATKSYKQIKVCKHCHCPVRDTIGNSGYCKKCIALANIINMNGGIRQNE